MTNDGYSFIVQGDPDYKRFNGTSAGSGKALATLQAKGWRVVRTSPVSEGASVLIFEPKRRGQYRFWHSRHRRMRVLLLAIQMMRHHRITCIGVGSAFTIAAVACGSRTGLDISQAEADAATDVPSSWDAQFSQESRLVCDGGLPTAYLLDKTGALYTFDPATLRTTMLGVPECGTSASPWTLSVSREGSAYLVFQDWNLYKVDLSTLLCDRIPLLVGQLGITSYFDIAISRTPGTERLFIVGRQSNSGSLLLLATSDLADFELTEVGPVIPTPPSSAPFDMQADLLGHLFLLAPDGLLVEVESATGTVIEEDMTGFPGAYVGSWAVMSYQNQVYLFGGESVARYDAQSHSVVSVGVALTRSQIVGASAIPCFEP